MCRAQSSNQGGWAKRWEVGRAGLQRAALNLSLTSSIPVGFSHHHMDPGPILGSWNMESMCMKASKVLKQGKTVVALEFLRSFICSSSTFIAKYYIMESDVKFRTRIHGMLIGLKLRGICPARSSKGGHPLRLPLLLHLRLHPHCHLPSPCRLPCCWADQAHPGQGAHNLCPHSTR